MGKTAAQDKFSVPRNYKSSKWKIILNFELCPPKWSCVHMYLILLAAAAASPAAADPEIFLALGALGTGARFGLNFGFSLILTKG